MSASGYKQTFQGVSQNVRFAPESRHPEAQERFGLKKRTLDVRFAPIADIGEGIAECPLMTQSGHWAPD